MQRWSHQARISLPTGDTFLSADTPYDRDVVFDHVHLETHHHRCVRLELDRHSYLVQAPPRGPQSRCSQCHRPVGPLAYSGRLGTACERCVRGHNART